MLIVIIPTYYTKSLLSTT